MTNEQLAILIQEGHTEYIEQLWLQIRPLLFKMANLYYHRYSEHYKKAGITLDDMTQETFFALLEAVHAFKAEKGYKLTTYLTYHLKTTFNCLAGHKAKSRLNEAISIETPIRYDEGNPLTVADTIEDKTAIEDIENTERAIYNKQLQIDVETAFKLLTPVEKNLIIQKYYRCNNYSDIAHAYNITLTQYNNIIHKALNKLSKNKTLRNRYKHDIPQSFLMFALEV